MSWVTKNFLLVGAVTAIVAAVIILQGQTSGNLDFTTKDGLQVPIPFLRESSSLTGRVTYLGLRNGLGVYEVTYENGETSELLRTDRVYLVHVPDFSDIVDLPLDAVFSSVTTNSRDIDYFGYKYSDSVATLERTHIRDPLFASRFPASFFASARARATDAAHGNMIAVFEQSNNVVFHKTDGTAGSIRLQPGSLYVFVVNETGGAHLSVRRVGICGNTILDLTEQCDDGNDNDSDECTNECLHGIPIPFGAECGNDVTEASEACDDGNANAGDGCSATCAIEDGYTCNSAAPSVCTPVDSTTCPSGTLEENGADGIAGNADDEQCDDNNVANGDGCSAACQIEQGFICNTGSNPSQCEALCGNGSTEENGADAIAGNADDEQCDDANVASGDGCFQCRIESGYICNTGSNPSQCEALCGNGSTEENGADAIAGNADDEQCDDANVASGDGCFQCRIESGYICNTGSNPSQCEALCGNGSTEENGADEIAGNADDEQCDDANVASGDGCFQCRIESGFICNTSPNPSECEADGGGNGGGAVCGNGSTEENGADGIAETEDDEQCDDGSSNGTPCTLPPGTGGASCQYCSASCKIVTLTGDPTPSAVCGNGAIEEGETCDDEDTDSSDGCSSVCAIEAEFRCTGEPSECVSYLNYVKGLADTNQNGTVSDNEALILTLDVADAPDQPYSTVQQFDMDLDGDVDTADISAVLGQLDVLAP